MPLKTDCIKDQRCFKTTVVNLRRQSFVSCHIILSDIPPRSVIDYSEEWTDEDLADFTKQGWANLEEQESFDGVATG